MSNLLRKKNLAARQARKYVGTQRGLRALATKKALGKLFQKTLRQEKSNSWIEFTSNLEGYRNISTLFKNLKHDTSFSVPLLKHNNRIARSPDENLEILRLTHYKNSTLAYSLDYGDNSPMGELPPVLSEFFDLPNLRKAIQSLPNGKAPGPDGIKNEILKRLPNSYVCELLGQFRASISGGFIPTVWLNMDAFFIKKGGDRVNDEPKTYRPIGLSSSILKLCERLINWRLKDTILRCGVPKQHAFTIGLSTETAISDVVNFLEKAKFNGQKALVMSIDIEGAFDTIPFDVIKDSLVEHGAEHSLVCWLDYLSRNRVIQSKLNGALIKFRPREGTTQGGINGPDLWVICVWSIIFLRAARASKIAKFADDLISALMGRDLDVMRDVLQSCLDEMVQWFTERGLTISANKSYCMIINEGRSKANLKPLQINGSEIPYVNSFKYLGVVIDSELSWKPHVLNRVKKAKTDLMLAKKLVTNNWGLTPSRMAWLYESIVRPAIDYACHVWLPTGNLKGWISKELDKVQRLALTAITACMYTTPTRAIERLVNIPPLELHLKEKAANTVARIYNSVDKSNWDGIGSNNKRGHLFEWKKYLGRDLPPISKAYAYNFSKTNMIIDSGSHDMLGLTIFTDGSKTEQGTGLGWAIYNDRELLSKGCRKLPDHSTVFEAEMLAIVFALKDFVTLNHRVTATEVTVLVDNQATLKTLNKVKLKGETALRVMKELEDFESIKGFRPTFQWIKGHSGNLGNDEADKQAKKGGREGELHFIKPSLSYIKSKVRERVRTEWDKTWNKLTTCRQSREMITFKPNNGDRSSLFSKGRQGCRKMISLLTGHNNLKYHVFKRKVSSNPNTSPCCRYCEFDLETSWHLLYDCPRFDTRRREFLFSSENPKKGPDIDWYYNLASHLRILDVLLDREYLDGDDDD